MDWSSKKKLFALLLIGLVIEVCNATPYYDPMYSNARGQGPFQAVGDACLASLGRENWTGEYEEYAYPDYRFIWGCFCHSNPNNICEYVFPVCEHKNYTFDEGRRLCVLESGRISSQNHGSPDCKRGDVTGGTNPIDLASGNKFQHEVDYSFTGSFPLRVERFYNSGSGQGWTFSYSRRLSLSDPVSSLTPHALKVATLILDDGKSLWFHKTSNENWINVDGGATGQLFELDEGFEYRTSDSVELFDSYGNFVSQEKEGNRHTVYRGPAGHVLKIDDSFGNELHFKYLVRGSGEYMWIQEVYAKRPSDDIKRKIIAYDSGRDSGSRANLVFVASYLDSLGEPFSRRRYEYNGSRLLSIIDGDDVVLSSWEYQLDGKAISSNSVDRGRYEVIYASDRTEAVNPYGLKTTYRFKTINGAKKVTSIEGSAGFGCESTYRTREYDEIGLLVKSTDAEGIVTEYEYNDRGLETKRVEAAGLLKQRISETTWHDEYPRMLKVREGNKETEYSYDPGGRLIKVTESAVGEGL